jgi:tyrosyl-tRNA synthetase
LTTPLLTDASGKKYGKSDEGRRLPRPEADVAYDFYSYWLNTADADVGRFLRVADGAAAGGDRSVSKRRRAASGWASGRWRRTSRARSRRGRRLAGIPARQTRRLSARRSARRPGNLAGQRAGAAPSTTVPRSRFDGEARWSSTCSPRWAACPSKSDARRQLGAAASPVTASRLGTASVETKVKAGD